MKCPLKEEETTILICGGFMAREQQCFSKERGKCMHESGKIPKKEVFNKNMLVIADQDMTLGYIVLKYEGRMS